MKDICKISPQDKKKIKRKFAGEAKENLIEQLSVILQDNECSDEEIVCAIEGIIEGVNEVLEEAKLRVEAL